jgi:hypothetical protein
LNFERVAVTTVGPGSVHEFPVVLTHQRKHCVFVIDERLFHTRVRPQEYVERLRHRSSLACEEM